MLARATTFAPVPPIFIVSITPAPVPKLMLFAFADDPIFIVPVVPESIVKAVAAGVVRSIACPPAKVTTPVDARLKFEEVRVKALAPKVKVEGAAPVRLSAPEELIVTTPVPWPMFEIPEEESVVKAPELGVPEPIVPGASQVLPSSEEAFIVPPE